MTVYTCRFKFVSLARPACLKIELLSTYVYIIFPIFYLLIIVNVFICSYTSCFCMYTSSQKLLCSIGSANIKKDDGHIFMHCYSMEFFKIQDIDGVSRINFISAI